MGQITLGEQASPTTPASGVIIYPTIATPSLLMIKDDAGNDRPIVLVSGSVWTPGISFGGGVTGITYAANGQVGRYYRFYNTIIATGYIELTNKGSSTGSAVITGLPVASLNQTNFFQPVILRPGNLTGITGMVQGAINPNGSTIVLTYLGTGAHAALTDANFTNTSHFMVTAIYEVS